MKNTVTLNDFKDAFKDHDRQDSFSYEGFEALFDSLEEYEKDCDIEIELDIVAIDCEYTEYENFEELQDVYDDIENMDDLRDNTIVIEIANTDRFIIQDY